MNIWIILYENKIFHRFQKQHCHSSMEFLLYRIFSILDKHCSTVMLWTTRYNSKPIKGKLSRTEQNIFSIALNPCQYMLFDREKSCRILWRLNWFREYFPVKCFPDAIYQLKLSQFCIVNSLTTDIFSLRFYSTNNFIKVGRILWW